MSSLIFLPFLASSGLAAALSPPPSFAYFGRFSFFFYSAMSPPSGLNDRVPQSSPRHALILTEGLGRVATF